MFGDLNAGHRIFDTFYRVIELYHRDYSE